MTFTFHKNVPITNGRAYVDRPRAQDLIDECIDNANEWAQVPITYLFPALEGADEMKLKTKARNLANRIQRGTVAPFNEYPCEAKSRGTDVYIRVVMSIRDRRKLEEF